MNVVMEDEKVVRAAVKVSVVSIVVNVTLSVLKLIAGIVGSSMALVSDAVHSLSDVFGSIIVIVGVKISKKKEDSQHPYGHDRFECMASLVLADVLVITGALIIYEGIKSVAGNGGTSAPTMVAAVAAVISIVVKEGMYWYTRATAKKINSEVLMAEAWHQRSDAISSVGSLVGVVCAMYGLTFMDPLMAVIIGVIIFKVAYDIAKEATEKLIDKSCSDEVVEAMSRTALDTEGVLRLDSIKTRQFGTKIYVDIEISAEDSLTLFESHEIAENVHHGIEHRFGDVKHCTVHVNPISQKQWGS